MADINHAHETPHTERDGIEYRGLAWSMIVLAVVTLVCYGIVVGLFKFLESRAAAGDPARAPLAAPYAQPAIVDGRLMPGNTAPPTALLLDEPINLQRFRAQEDHLLTSYSWMDQNAGTIRMPIERAKDLLLDRGLPIRPVPAGPTPAVGPVAKGEAR
jgi:hypothetical protein